MKYLITMLAVFIFSCAITAQTPNLKAGRGGIKGASPQETWGHKEQAELGKVHKAICLWQEKKASVSHDVPIMCGEGDGKCGVKDCKCSCHKKDTKRHSRKKSTSKGRTSRSKRGHRRSGSKGRSSHNRRSGFKGRSSRFGSKRGTSRRSHTRSYGRKGPSTKKAKDTKEVNDATKKRIEGLKKRIEKWRKEHGK